MPRFLLFSFNTCECDMCSPRSDGGATNLVGSFRTINSALEYVRTDQPGSRAYEYNMLELADDGSIYRHDISHGGDFGVPGSRWAKAGYREVVLQLRTSANTEEELPR